MLGTLRHGDWPITSSTWLAQRRAVQCNGTLPCQIGMFGAPVFGPVIWHRITTLCLHLEINQSAAVAEANGSFILLRQEYLGEKLLVASDSLFLESEATSNSLFLNTVRELLTSHSSVLYSLALKSSLFTSLKV
jgi:hypothetical protein